MHQQRSCAKRRFVVRLLTAALVGTLATTSVLAAQQPPLHSGHFKPMIAVASPPGADNTLGMAILSAVVNSDGTIARGAGATASSRIVTGQYEVDFGRDVSGCAYVSTVGSPTAGASARGQPTVAPRSGNSDGVFVETQDSTGNDYSLPFHLIVFCAK